MSSLPGYACARIHCGRPLIRRPTADHPLAYKDIDQVMADQADLVEVQHTLRQVFNYKGT